MCLAFHTELSAGTERRHNKDNRVTKQKRIKKMDLKKCFLIQIHIQNVFLFMPFTAPHVSHRLGLIHAHTHMYCIYKLK